LKVEAEARAAGKEAEKKKPIVVKYGLNHITTLVEQGKAQMVVIAHDVDPIELVVWLPALCRKMGVPYCIVKVRLVEFMRVGISLVHGISEEWEILQNACVQVQTGFHAKFS
jgi:hypothetical protein